MGTNYYIKPKGTTCDHQDHWIHLGKSSMGWRFTFQAYPNGFYPCNDDVPTWPVVDYDSWLRLFDLGEIYDEYGHKCNAAFIREAIRRKAHQMYGTDPHGYLDEAGHHFVRGEFS